MCNQWIYINRILRRADGTLKFLTKGDNNQVDDRGLYAHGQLWLTKADMVGRAKGLLPYVGMVTIVMNDYPNFKVGLLALHTRDNALLHCEDSRLTVVRSFLQYAVLGVLALYVLLHRE